jgi:hypothetical protein
VKARSGSLRCQEISPGEAQDALARLLAERLFQSLVELLAVKGYANSEGFKHKPVSSAGHADEFIRRVDSWL